MAAVSTRFARLPSGWLQSSGLEVVDVELRGGGKARMLRIFIDKPGGVTHDDCSNFSREVGTIFDVEDAVPGGTYTLEVSSPGLDRKLSKAGDFERFTGSLVKLMTRDPVNGNRHFEGRLKSFQDGRLELELTPPKKSKKHEAVEAGTRSRDRVGQRREGQPGSGVLGVVDRLNALGTTTIGNEWRHGAVPQTEVKVAGDLWQVNCTT